MAVLSLKNVKKEYHVGEITIPAVEDVSFELNEGEFVVILGASGAGKTTLLNLLGGMDRATSGEIIIDGKNINLGNIKMMEDLNISLDIVENKYEELLKNKESN